MRDVGERRTSEDQSWQRKLNFLDEDYCVSIMTIRYRMELVQ